MDSTTIPLSHNKWPAVEVTPMVTEQYFAQPGYPNTPPRRAPTSSRAKEWANRFWIWEALSCVVSLIFYAAIMLQLYFYNGERYDVVGAAKVSGNAKAPIFPILSILSAILKAAMLMPVASAISQAKWIWFRKERKLVHLNRFDEASRGILGSLRLLVTVRFTNFVVIGAVLTVLSLPMDAFIQSSVQLRPIKTVNQTPLSVGGNYTITNETYVSRTTQYTVNSTQVMTTEEERWPQLELINGIQFGISYMSGIQDAVTADIPVLCPTAECDFGFYQTLTVESYCIDRSTEVRESSNGQVYILPGTNLTLRKDIRGSSPKGLIAAESTNATDTNHFAKLGPGIVRTSLLVNMWKSDPVAMDCMLYWSVQTLHGLVNATKLGLQEYSKPLNTSWEKSDVGSYSMYPSPCWVNNTLVSDKDSQLYKTDCHYYVSPKGHKALQRFLLDEDYGLVGASYLYSREPWHYSRTNNFISNVHELSLSGSGDQARFTGTEGRRGSLAKMFENIALIMTNTIRNTYREHPDNLINPNMRYFQHRVNGTVYETVFFYHVLWPRLALPTGLIFGSIFFFVMVAIMNRNGSAWKRSSLPLLFYGLGMRERAAAGEPATVSEMSDIAENMRVRLAMTGEGLRMVGYRPGGAI